MLDDLSPPRRASPARAGCEARWKRRAALTGRRSTCSLPITRRSASSALSRDADQLGVALWHELECDAGADSAIASAGAAQLALAAGVLDELELHVIPVFFGQGRRLFDGLAPEHIELERTRILEERAVSPTCTTGSAAKVSFPRPSFPGLG